MAPHTEKSQLISKPATRRTGSKSPSKPPAEENDEMPQQPQNQTAPRKVSVQLPQVIVPGRKISAPELTRPPVKRGGRRNLFMERCISQEEKENIKSKPPMRKFSTPSISISNGTSKGENENSTEQSTNGDIKEVKSNSAPKVEAPKTIIPVYDVCTTTNKKKETCQITKPQIQENVPIPVNRINRIIKPSLDDRNKENARIIEEESPPLRKMSMPMFHISQEGSSKSKPETRKLYTERCISTEEKENIKSKPAKKKPPQEPLNSKQATTSQDSEIKEKVQLKPKSAQRKLSAPAKMMTPPPTVPMPSGNDLLSNGIILDLLACDDDIPSIREEDGRPSFAKAAKVIHAKVQAVSCFRSSGAMPIPRLPPKIPIARPKPRKLEPPSTQEAQEIDLDIPTEIVNKLPDFDYSSLEQFLTESTVPRLTRCMIIPHPKIIDIINGFKGINEDVILRNRSVAKMPRPPPPPSEYMKSSCKLHSRCHCNLLSKKVDGFFDVTPNK